MAVGVTLTHPSSNRYIGEEAVALATWASLLNGEAGTAVKLANYASRCVQISGTFGVGGSVSIEGSNDGTTWAVLSDSLGNALTKTAAALDDILENPRELRARVTAGDGTTNLKVTILAA